MKYVPFIPDAKIPYEEYNKKVIDNLFLKLKETMSLIEILQNDLVILEKEIKKILIRKIKKIK